MKSIKPLFWGIQPSFQAHAQALLAPGRHAVRPSLLGILGTNVNTPHAHTHAHTHKRTPANTHKMKKQKGLRWEQKVIEMTDGPVDKECKQI